MKNFTDNIKQWIVFDTQIDILKKDYQEKLKDLKENKQSLEVKLTNYMKAHELQNTIIQTSEGKIKYNEINIQSPLNYKFLLDVFKEGLEDEEKADQLLQLIKTKRESKKQISLKRNI